MNAPTVLVVAKAPVPGQAKTRIARDIGDDAAAELAAAALLDTLDTATATGMPVVVALTGDLERAARSDEIAAVLGGLRLVPQIGATFGERLAQAHVDADAGHGVIQVAMDSPQIRVDDLREAAELLDDHPSVLGPAEDGGWWLLAVRRGSDASGLASVEMSTASTGQHTLEVLPMPTALLRTLRDVDTWDDARAVAAELRSSRFGAAVAAREDGART
ncbi:TIGR04282 family arsenosugar biosynthesis glycosyltransferase [Aeromicrobium sp.]|uniref:TIGR04282 family arsenosugar biosynthesis glycosyltransferase n=1 Tax=Aeromicrobium sp. TaxID=1871063 RepID=UPI003D6B2132